MLALYFVVAVAAVHAAVAGSYAPPSIATLTSQIEALESTKDVLFEELSIVSNAADAAEEILKNFNVKLLPNYLQDIKNVQAVLDRALVQKNFLQKAVDLLASESLENKVLANSNADEALYLQDDISSLLVVDGYQVSNISAIQAAMGVLVGTTDLQIVAIAANGDSSLNSVAQELDRSNDLLENRFCESGMLTAAIPSNPTYGFVTNFENTPDIVTSVVGFKAHLVDVYGYDKPSSDISYTDLLGFNVAVNSVNPGGFSLNVTVTQDTAVRPKQIYIRFSACENLEVDIDDHY